MMKRLRNVGNLFVILLLRSPLHALSSGSLLLLSYRGRRSGRDLTVPVMYAEDGDDLIVFVGRPARKLWWRNLRGGAEVEVLLRGRRLRGRAVVTDAATAESYLERYPRARSAVAAELEPTFVRISALEPA